MAAPLAAGQSALLAATGAGSPSQAILAAAVPLGPDLGAGRIDVAGLLAATGEEN